MTDETGGSASPVTEVRESRLRSVLKAVSYRIIGTITTGIVAWWVTGDLSSAIAIGSVEPFVKMIIYYLHERAWQALPRGQVRHMFGRG